MNFLLIIYSCRKYIFLKDYYVNKYKELGYDVIFVFADPDMEDDADYIYDNENNMAVLKCGDDFENLTNKTYFLIKMILNSSRLKKYDYIIKMDDDTEFNIKYNNLVEMDFFSGNINYAGPKLLTSEPMEHDYHFGKCSNNMELNISPFELKEKLSWGSGYFYILSRHSLITIDDYVTNNPSILTDFLYEDMMVGKILYENNIIYEVNFSNNIITDLKRPRTTSLNKLIIQQQTSDLTFTKISSFQKSVGKIKKVSFNFNKPEIINNDDDELNEKIKKEVIVNQELDRKIRELTKKLNNNDLENNINNNLKNNTKNNIYTDTKKLANPIMTKNSKRITGKMMIKI